MKEKIIKAMMLAMMFAMLLSCGTGQRRAQHAMRAFPEIQIPSICDSEESKADYAAMHWWDAFFAPGDWQSDSVTVNGVSRDNIMMAMSAYMECLSSVPSETAEKSSARLFSQLEAYMKSDSASSAYRIIVDLVEKYLYDPNSPYRDEDVYLPFVKAVAESELTDDDFRTGYAYAARMCSLNRRGTVAPDFVFKDMNGKRRRMHDIKAGHTLLFFSNPGCQACRDIMERMESMEGVGEMIEDGRLAVVNIYIDEDLSAWKEYQSVYPKNWYNGYDPDLVIRNERLYNVRAIPSLYLLDADKKIVMKDAPDAKLFHWLEENK